MSSTIQNRLTLEDIRYLGDYLYAPTKVRISVASPYDNDYQHIYSGDASDIPASLWDIEVVYGDGINVEGGIMYIQVDLNDDEYLELTGGYNESYRRHSRSRHTRRIR